MSIEQMLQLRNHPGRKPVMYQSWQDLLFLHWSVDGDALQKFLPPGLVVDVFDNHAYVGIVPFHMRNIRYRFTTALPWLSNFLELNVRTYVRDTQGNPGVWFFSLDCNQPVAVWLARKLFHLPYYRARMRANQEKVGKWDYESVRSKKHTCNSASQFRYARNGEIWYAKPGSLEFFLVERYLLFAKNHCGKLFKGRVHHSPYPLQHVSVEHSQTDLFELNGFPVPQARFCHAIGSHGVDVEVFSLEL